MVEVDKKTLETLHKRIEKLEEEIGSIRWAILELYEPTSASKKYCKIHHIPYDKAQK